MKDIKPTSFNGAEPAESGRSCRLFFTDNEGDVILHVPTDQMEGVINTFIRAYRQARINAGEENVASYYEINKGNVYIDNEKNVVMGLEVTSGFDFHFRLDPTAGRALAESILKIADEFDLPDKGTAH